MTKPSLHIETVKIINVNDWDKFIQEVYGKPYSFQQQDGCKERGLEEFVCPEILVPGYDYTTTYIHFDLSYIYEDEMGVSFATWLSTSPQLTAEHFNTYTLNEIFWQRKFYPHISSIAHDLHLKGLLEPGYYTIDINW